MKATVTVFSFFCLFGLIFSYYRKHFFVKKEMTWTDAQTYCREYYHDLSTISGEEATLLSNNPEVTNEYWVGLHINSQNPNTWIWSTGEEATIINWDIGQPNDAHKNCGRVKTSTFKLSSTLCSLLLPFYCMEIFEPVLVQQNKTWEEALGYCRQNYADLVILNSETIMAEVINNITTAQTAHVWTGLRFLAGHWLWVSGDYLEYKAWSVEGELQCPAINLRCGAVDREEKA
ncbi:C-type mannose receptor 2-like isoform X2 [Myxocyprinus asiaticus]|uniref:C-type mannose receptor 2-like isoform X2 n=1 Tax=Myxocyprinus asiaticus TaxID=70543 RepID=UPI002222FFBF|nr:C-type mannose receptor 2-like isoform X2 [Myxocyprinus asiaticus]